MEDEAALHVVGHRDSDGGSSRRVGVHHGLGVGVGEVKAVAEEEGADER